MISGQVSRRGAEGSALLHRLTALVSLTPHEIALIDRLPHGRSYAPGDDILAEGRMDRSAEVIASGWAVRQRTLSDGRRQIFNFCLPGDFVRPASDAAAATSVAVTTVECIDATALRDAAVGEDPALVGLRRAWRLMADTDHALLHEHVVRLGRLTAYQRMAHLLLELRERLVLSGIVNGWRFAMPVTQEALADHLGLSIVHVNRTLQQLRREKMIELRGGHVTVLQPQVMKTMTDFKMPVLQGR